MDVVRNGCDVRDQRWEGMICNRYGKFGVIRRIVMGDGCDRTRLETRELQVASGAKKNTICDILFRQSKA